jgi:hypothetical protein
VDAKLSGKFPYPLDGIEIRAVRRQVIKVELRFMFLTPRAVKVGVVVSDREGMEAHPKALHSTTNISRALEQ